MTAAAFACDRPPTIPKYAPTEAEIARFAWMDATRAVWQSRSDQIDAELTQSNLPPWTGEYYCGDHLGMNITLRVSPTSVVYSWTGCVGALDFNYGTIREVREDRLVVDFARDSNDSRPIYHDGLSTPYLSSELLFVTWRERRYLIPSTQIMTLFNQLNSGARDFGDFPLRIRTHDASKSPWFELPTQTEPIDFPRDYEKFLLAKPVTATVRDVGPVEADDPYLDGTPKRKVRTTIDRGQDAGLWLGMRIWLHARESNLGHVTELSALESVVVFRGAKDSFGAMPKVGDVVSTR